MLVQVINNTPDSGNAKSNSRAREQHWFLRVVEVRQVGEPKKKKKRRKDPKSRKERRKKQKPDAVAADAVDGPPRDKNAADSASPGTTV